MPYIVKGEINFYAQNIKSGSFTAYEFGIYEGDTLPGNLAPYDGVSVSLTFPSTVYGGEVDAVRQGGNENAKITTIDGTKLKFSNANGFWNLPWNSAPGCAEKAIICCSHFTKDKFGINTSYEFVFTQQSSMIGLFSSADDLNAYCAAQYAAGTPVQIAYKLANPVPFTVTGGAPIKALPGTNTVLTDADSATVTGRADPVQTITKLNDRIAALEAAATNITE